MQDMTAMPQKPPLPPAPPTPVECGRQISHPATAEELISLLALDEKQRADLSQLTEKQSSSSSWHKHRQGRLTASNFHRVISRSKTLMKNDKTKNNDVSALVRTVLGLGEQYQTKAMKHGIAMEPHAKKAYKKIMSRRHKRFIATDSGFIVDRDFPYLGASPDLLIECSCTENCGLGLCEIKCPESISHQRPDATNYHAHLQEVDGATKLAKSSPHYFQIQGQMHVTGRQFCDFFVYTDHGHHLERVLYDDEFWQECFYYLTYFWKTFIAPELIYGKLSCSADVLKPVNEEHTYASKSSGRSVGSSKPQPSTSKGPLTKPNFKPLYLCSVCKREVVTAPVTYEQQNAYCWACKNWCHFTCAKVTNVAVVVGNTTWKCPKC